MMLESEARRWAARFFEGDIVRGPMGRRYRILEADHERHMYVVQRVKVNGHIDTRCRKRNFPAGYLSPLEACDG